MPYRLRPATPEDFPAIRLLIRQAGINPTGLDWRRFSLAVDAGDRLVGCGQIKPHGQHVRELASIAVQPEWRGQGVARAIIEHLLGLQPGPLYLTCRESLGPFYQRFGFTIPTPAEMPPYYRRLHRLGRFLRWLRLFDESLLVMSCQCASALHPQNTPQYH